MTKKTPKPETQPAPKKLTAADKCDAYGIELICEHVAECITLEKIGELVGVTKWDLLRFLNSDLHHDAHARARELQADKHAADILAISDEAEVEVKYDGEDVKLDLSSAAVARNRLRVDSRKWLAAKMAPKRYGDKVTTEHTGPGGGAVQVAVVDFKGLTDEELASMHELMLKAGAG